MKYDLLADNPLKTRADCQRAVQDLFDPLLPYYCEGGSRVLPNVTGHPYSVPGAGLEGFARPLWALAPLAAGGGTFGHWDLFVRGITRGVDPEHPGYWGIGGDGDQRYVEYASLGVALCLVPDRIWDPLPERTRTQFADWLGEINRHRVGDNNWKFFRVLANLGLRLRGAGGDSGALEAAFGSIEGMFVGDGWYSDGASTQYDYYIAWAMHFYGLIYAKLNGEDDPGRAARFRERAAAYALDHQRWFAADGSGIPYGRSLTYRFAQSAFWGALAFADVEALPWGVIKGLALRNIRWWLQQPVFSDRGVLSIGYGFPNRIMAEEYNGPGSPYWAMKAFLPLALPESHPFWKAEELPLPEPAGATISTHVQSKPGMILCRDVETDHTFALTAGQHAPMGFRNVPEKYAKFAYSTAFAFCVSAQRTGCVPDSMLAFSEEGRYWRVREEVEDWRVETDFIWSRCRPWPDVEVETWLIPALPWHVRVHRVRTDRALRTLEGGFAIDPLDDLVPCEASGKASAMSSHGFSGIRDQLGARRGTVSRCEPNLNLIFSRARLPMLEGDLEPGEHWLACAVLGIPGTDRAGAESRWGAPPALQEGPSATWELSRGESGNLVRIPRG